ncbi:MAG: hypothetical protein M3Q77_01420 [Thermoproteota archaeon]|nr:hypothetical protein [Thermoproteota archaeon]
MNEQIQIPKKIQDWKSVTVRLKENDVAVLNSKLKMNEFKTFSEFVHGWIDGKYPVHQKDETYKRIIKKLDDFMTRLPSPKDKELLLGMISEAYYKHHKAIQTKSESDTELLLSTLMAIIIEQNVEIKRLEQIIS